MAAIEESLIGVSPFRNNQEYAVHDWIKHFQNDNLKDSDFRMYWGIHVPEIYSPKSECDCLNISFDEQTARNVLFLPLEEFICNSNEPEKVLEELKNSDDPPTLCGKVFKMGEPTYSCRDCGLDPTCVLCVECFRNSVHKNHRYKMSVSSGGGYCDCGDQEAWKSHAFCDVHIQRQQQANKESSPVDRLPPDLVARLQFVLRAALSYCYDMLTWEQAINLPRDLSPKDASNRSGPTDTYVTMLFNDETHTYEQVIQTLNRAVECSQKEAVDFATTIDREGRSIVKCANFATCKQVCHVIERVTSRHGSKPLKVLVMHTIVVAHQVFSMRLLAWLQQILTTNEAFRIVFNGVMMEPTSMGTSLLESIMLKDTCLWKTARNQWHQLFISGMLMDQQCKKTFAKVFTKNYPVLMKDFIADDHEHSVSVTSLSVQIFTVPTLAHMLIVEEDAIAVLLRTFCTECEGNQNSVGKLAFERNQSTINFRRAQYVLYDLKYLLSVKPREWHDALRKSFLHGVHRLLDLLVCMQGMDLVVRQVGQHVEFEPEWETGVNLQLKLAPVIALVLEWCGSDRVVLVKAIRAALRQLEASQGKMVVVGRELVDHSASCIDYDVSSSSVTIHLPLSRFVAGLLLHLEKYDLTYDLPEFHIRNKPSPEQLMELPLRTQVMVAQFRAGMWRRNGYSFVNQVYFYHNVRLRDEMYDKDIMMLQIAASLIESNEFLIHLLNKFGLLLWARDDYDGNHKKAEDDYVRQTVALAEEFLGLVLIIVSERFTPGIGKVTHADRIKKEIIQLLCIEPMPHSQLYKLLPKDPNHETGMESVIDEVAVFRKPHGATGKYELKPEYYKDFNPFFYHYTREEQSKAEEIQLKRKKQAGEEECCPPPVPPEFCAPFAMIVNILQSDVMLHVMGLVLKRTGNLLAASFSETQFEKVLHLVGLALHEEQRQIESGAEDSFFCFTDAAAKKGILAILEECVSLPRIETHKDLLNWTIRKFKSVQKMRQKSSENVEEQMEAEFSGEPSSSFGGRKERKRNAEMAAARRARIMAQMSAMQKNFIKEHPDFFKQEELEEGRSSITHSGSQMDLTESSSASKSVCLGVAQEGRVINTEVHTCILCREKQEITAKGRTMVLAAFVQRSTVLSKNRKREIDDPETFDPLLMPADRFFGPHVSTCGHVMHSDCWQKFFDSVLTKERRRPIRYGRHVSFDVDKNEFLCPLCECLSNTVIPLIPPVSVLSPQAAVPSQGISLHDWLMGMHKAVERVVVQRVRDPSSEDEESIKFINQYKPTPLLDVIQCLPPDGATSFRDLLTAYQKIEEGGEDAVFSESFMDMMRLFSQATYTVGLGLNVHPEDERLPLLSWWSCVYTIQAIEWLLRDLGRPIFGDLSSRKYHCLEALVRFVGTGLSIFDPNVVRSHCVKIYKYLLNMDHYMTSSQSILDVDAFALVVSLSVGSPCLFLDANNKAIPVTSLFPVGNTVDQHIVHMAYMFHLVQILLTMRSEDLDLMDIDEQISSRETLSPQQTEQAALSHFYSEVLVASGSREQCLSSLTPEQLLKYVCDASLPFLRCCAIFFHFLTNIAPPQELKDGTVEEYEVLCRYLGLPPAMNELLASSSLRQLALSWARHPGVIPLLSPVEMGKDAVGSSQPVLIRQPPSINQLVSLPTDYSELINSISQFPCPNSDGDDSRSPTMCLVCGEILCSQSYCCQTELYGFMVGACTYHAHFCGAGVGIFLRVRDCKIVLLAGRTKGCYLAPPYLDEYGETDQGLVRGNPLHLCPKRYKELHHLWLRHGIPEQIAHALEQSSSMAVTSWHLL